MNAVGAAPSVARVMICDDSAVTRGAIASILARVPGVAVVARAANGQAALDALRVQAIDVVVLDIEMPVMDGLTALPLLLRASPGLAVIIASSQTARGADISLQALRLGAAETLAKPSAAGLGGEAPFARELAAKVLGLASRHRRGGAAPRIVLRPPPAVRASLLAIGSSTGGPQALLSLVRSLRPDLAVPVIVTQHMPAAFTAALARHIDGLGVLPCAEARDGETLLPGRIHIAPGDAHLLVQRCAGGLCANLSAAPPEHSCRPAVDPMLRTASAAVDGRLLVAMLTGMGQDGLDGARRVVSDGGAVVVQDEATSVIWGMPGAIAKAGLACAVLPLAEIGGRLQAMLAAGGRA